MGCPGWGQWGKAFMENTLCVGAGCLLCRFAQKGVARERSLSPIPMGGSWGGEKWGRKRGRDKTPRELGKKKKKTDPETP